MLKTVFTSDGEQHTEQTGQDRPDETVRRRRTNRDGDGDKATGGDEDGGNEDGQGQDEDQVNRGTTKDLYKRS